MLSNVVVVDLVALEDWRVHLLIAAHDFLTGYQQYHNYFRGHMGLDGQTPAEAAGIKIEGRTKYLP